MHKTSELTFVFKYLFPIIFVAGFSFQFAHLLYQTPAINPYFIWSELIVTLWVGIFIVRFPFTLKEFVVSETGLKLKSGITINFSDIESLAYLDISNPISPTISYLDKNKNTISKISYLPQKKYQLEIGEDKMTLYIRQRASEENKNFKPSTTLKNLKNILLLIIPFLIAISYCLIKGVSTM